MKKLIKILNFLRLQKIDQDEIKKSCGNLAKIYDKDISYEHLTSECIHLKYCISEIQKEEMSILDMYLLIIKEFLSSTFPNVEIILRIFLSLMVTNCSGERSFSRLKLIKNDHRNMMSQSRLNYLSLMNIESNLLTTLNFDELIVDFARKKCRRKIL